MCGRYYVDSDTADEIEKIIRRVDGKIKAGTDQTMRAAFLNQPICHMSGGISNALRTH